MIDSEELKIAQGVMLKLLKAVDAICKKHGLQYFLISGSLLGAVRHKGFIPWDDDMDIAMMRSDYEKFKQICLNELPEDMALQTRDTDPYYDVYHVPCKIRDKNSLFVEPGKENNKGLQGIYIDVFPFDKHSTDMLKINKDLRFWNVFMFLQRYTKKTPKSKLHALALMPFTMVARLCLLCYFALAKKRIKKSEQRYKDNYTIMPGYDLFWSKINIFDKDDIFPLKEMQFEDAKFYVPNNSDKVLRMIYNDYMKLPPENARTAHAIRMIANLKNQKI